MTVVKDYHTPESRSQWPLAGLLLAHVANGSLPGEDCLPEDCDAKQFEWVIASGLGPLFFHAYSASLAVLPEEWRDRLRSAEMTARVMHACRIETTMEILEVCDAAKVPAVLLKGISVSEELYPADHLRPMTDIDVLLPRPARAVVEDALLRRGFRRLPWQYDPGSHHGAPLCQPRLRSFVELHFALFPTGSPLSQGTTFQPERLLKQSVNSTWRGRPVLRLPPAIQLAYTASSWHNDIRTAGLPDPTHLPAAFDAAYLLRRYGSSIDWMSLLESLDNSWVKASLHLTLSYLEKYGVPPPPQEILDRLSEDRSVAGPVQRHFICQMLDCQLFGAQPWRGLFPPPVLGRYSIRQQFRRRFLTY